MEKRLGKGLAALISEDTSKVKEKVKKVKLTDIVPSSFQPRKRFGPEKMEELVSSIREKGVIQPVLVRPRGTGYELIAGERRWRAAQQLQIEEIQREELNPIEEASAYQELISQFEYTLDKVGQMMGKDKTTISNSLRLLTLPEEIRSYVEDGRISTGHAKALLSITSGHRRKKLAGMIVRKGISVRETEQLVRRAAGARIKAKKAKDSEIMRIEEELQHRLGTKVNIQQGKKRGRIEIQYFSNEDLQRLLRIILQAV